jgi:transcriptional regulator with XRE-family HTH domain
MSDNLATYLNSEMDRRGWSLRQIARRAAISHTTVVKMANGVGHPEVETCRALARALDVPVENILILAGILPAQKNGASVRDRVRVVYEVNGDELVLQLWRALSPEDQRIVRDLMERLVPSNQVRIVGEEE